MDDLTTRSAVKPEGRAGATPPGRLATLLTRLLPAA
jgi:hypothetical protein